MEETDASVVLTERDESCGLSGPLQPSVYPEKHIKIQAAERKRPKNMYTEGSQEAQRAVPLVHVASPCQTQSIPRT